MRVKVLFFGVARDLTGVGQDQVDLRDGEQLGDLWRRYERRFPRLAEMSGSLVAAVNEELADRSHRLSEGDEVAFLPPVSGGRDDATADVYGITHDVIRAEDLAGSLKAPGAGAVVAFEGIVRDNLRGRQTRYLEYEAYEPMARRKMAEIGAEARGKFPIGRIGIVHRTGRLEIGETSVAIVVTASHRAAAFEACHFLIDRLKQVVPIWKKEYFEDGEMWAETPEVLSSEL